MTVRPRRRSALALAALPVLLAGCTGGGSGTSATQAGSVGGPSGPSSSVPGGAVPTGPATSPPGVDDAPPELLLQGDGLGVLAGDASVEPLPFVTTTWDAVQPVVEDALGPVAPVPVPDCPLGPREAWSVDGFTVLLDAGRFVGWTDDGAQDRVLTTPEGLGTGSRLDEVQSALPGVQVTPRPDGASFSSPNGLSGLLTGADPAAEVTAISGGQTCGG